MHTVYKHLLDTNYYNVKFWLSLATVGEIKNIIISQHKFSFSLSKEL